MTKSLRELEPYVQAARNLRGWQLDYLPEPLTPGPPWDYEARARTLAGASGDVLDLGTGGGEVLSRIIDRLDCRAVATEEWVVNAPVAAHSLQGKATVIRACAETLPFRSGVFDLVLSRHEAIRPSEVGRVLKRSGRFLTQQVIPDLWHELRAIFPEMTRFPDHFATYQAEFARAGFVIDDAREFRRPVRFYHLGHLVYHLAAMPWMIPNFGLNSHRVGLEELDQQIARGEPLILTEGYYLLEAHRDAGTGSA